MTATLVLKFGGAAVATPAHFSRIADIAIARRAECNNIIIVVSAMGGTTDALAALAREVNPHPPRREYDMLVSVGERISISLLAMALAKKGVEAVSFTGSQSGIITTCEHSDAEIVEVRPRRLLPPLEAGKIVIVAGFQGVSTDGEITTLGRGGSDTSAVALAAALNAEKVEFYKDVDGVYSADPKTDPGAVLLRALSYRELADILEVNPQIIAPRAVSYARKQGVTLHIRPFSDMAAAGTLVGAQVSVGAGE